MAQKTAAQVITGLQAYVALWRIVNDLAEGAWTNQIESLSAAIDAGDNNYITDAQHEAIRSMTSAMANFVSSVANGCRTVAPMLGELAGSPSPGSDMDADLAFLNDYFVTNSKAVPTRGFTKATWTAGGSNTGTGRILQLKTDFLTQDIDCAHPEAAYTMRVKASAGRGVREGEEPFSIVGTKANRPWEDNGVGNQPVYAPALGKGFNEIDSTQLRVAGLGIDVNAMNAMAGNSSRNLLGTNGAFETAVSGTGVNKYSGFTFISGETNASEETTAPIKGAQSMKIDGNMVFYSTLNTQKLVPKTALAFGALVKKVISSSTLTGTLTIILRSGGDKDVAAQGTAHSTITVTIGSLASNTVTDEDSTLIVPAVLGADPRIEYTVTSYSDGSGTANSLLMDEFYCAPMYQLDMGQFLLPVSGVTPFEKDDRWTSSVNDLAAASDDGIGKNQEFLNRLYGRYLRHSAGGTTWTDPVLAPEVQAYNSAGTAVNDGGSIALGTTSVDPQNVVVTFENTGNYPLAIAAPSTANATNATLSASAPADPVIVMPNRKLEITIAVDPTGVGAYTIDVIWPNNDSSESTYAITISGTAA